MKGSKITFGAVLAAALAASSALLFLAGFGSLVASRWLFMRWHPSVWVLGFFGFNALFVTVAIVLQVREDHRTRISAKPPEPAAPRPLARVGTPLKPR